MGRGGVHPMKRYALLFAGQGAQFAGMGLPLLEQTPDLKPYAKTLENSLGIDILNVLQGEDGRLQQTLFTQPAIVFTSLLLYRQLQAFLPYDPNAVAGFSLGEITALTASGALSESAMFSLLSVRAKAMEEATKLHPGKMVAVLGASDDQLQQMIEKVAHLGPVYIVNYNSPGQRVLSGDDAAIDALIPLAPNFGARRAIPLAVSGAFHSPFMKHAYDALHAFLPSLSFQTPRLPQYMNKTAQPATLAEIPRLVAEQVMSPVQFESTLRTMADEGIDTFIEIGPGSVLAGLVKKTLPEARVVSYNGLADEPLIKELLL